MPSYMETLRLTGLSEAQFSWEDYQKAVRLTKAKAKDGNEAFLFPYVLHDLMFAWYTQRRYREVRR